MAALNEYQRAHDGADCPEMATKKASIQTINKVYRKSIRIRRHVRRIRISNEGGAQRQLEPLKSAGLRLVPDTAKGSVGRKNQCEHKVMNPMGS